MGFIHLCKEGNMFEIRNVSKIFPGHVLGEGLFGACGGGHLRVVRYLVESCGVLAHISTAQVCNVL